MELVVDDSSDVCFPGSVVHGAFTVHTCVDPSLQPVIRANGYTLVWKSEINKETDEYSLFYDDKAVLSPEENVSDLSLNNEPRGSSKVFKFHLVLPDNIPPSHEVSFGHTRYKLEAYYNGQTIFRYFSVSQWVGLEKRNNNIVKLGKLSVSLFNFCQPIAVTLTLNQTYYLPGETVYVGALTTNSTWKDVIFSKIFIIQTTKYWKHRHMLPVKHVRVIAEGTRGHLPGGCSQIWDKEPLYIPAVIPTTKKSNNPFNYFEVKYKIKMQIALKTAKMKTMLKQKLFIGNWDKTDNCTDSCTCVNMPTNNGPPNEIIASECLPIKLENIDYVPKYVIYETSRE